MNTNRETTERPEAAVRRGRGRPWVLSYRSRRVRGLCFREDAELQRLMPAVLIAVGVLVVLLAVLLIAGRNVLFEQPEIISPTGDDIPTHPAETGPSITTPGSHPFADGPKGSVLLEYAQNSTVLNQQDVNAVRSCVVDMSTGKIIASRKSQEKMYPASMTKLMTLIVAVENLAESVSLSHTITISDEVYNKMKAEGASGIGLEAGEQLSVEALLYMTVLQSDGIAATELARYVAGSEADFVSLMNRKAAMMGLTDTHFANPTGLHDEGNYSTCQDMATILWYAMHMSLCRQILTTETYTATCKAGGKTFPYYVNNNLTVTYLKDKYKDFAPKNVTIKAGKTGWTGKNSGYCLASYAVTPEGHEYIVVTSQSDSIGDYIKDHAILYGRFAK